MIGDGHGLREIAAELGISWWTAKAHRDAARVRLGASTTAHAAAILAGRPGPG